MSIFLLLPFFFEMNKGLHVFYSMQVILLFLYLKWTIMHLVVGVRPVLGTKVDV